MVLPSQQGSGCSLHIPWGMCTCNKSFVWLSLCSVHTCWHVYPSKMDMEDSSCHIDHKCSWLACNQHWVDVLDAGITVQTNSCKEMLKYKFSTTTIHPWCWLSCRLVPKLRCPCSYSSWLSNGIIFLEIMNTNNINNNIVNTMKAFNWWHWIMKIWLWFKHAFDWVVEHNESIAVSAINRTIRKEIWKHPGYHANQYLYVESHTIEHVHGNMQYYFFF